MKPMAYKLNPRLEKCLTQNLKWKDLRDIQKKAFNPISDKNNTLIVSGTASGKTEAALLPIFNNMLTSKLSGLRVLYLAPLKALINDLNLRILNFATPLGLVSSPWHGDVKYNEKFKSLDDTNILIITPESLESLLTTQKTDNQEIFKQIEYIIVDEIHYFATSPRGYQLISLINRVSRYSESVPIRIGLSATVENKGDILDFLCSNDSSLKKVVVSENGQIKRDIRIIEAEDQISLEKVIQMQLQADSKKKFLVFAHSKSKVESFANALSEMDIKVEVHHASVGKEIRQTVESSFKKSKIQVVIATSTLELGIDIGDIDQVFFLDVPNSASSFLQRLGRSGRLSSNPKCWITFDKTRPDQIFKILGIHYMLEIGSVESIELYSYCPQIFAHQMLSFIYENQRLSSSDLECFLNVFCFSKLNESDSLKDIFSFLVDKDYISKEDKSYIPSTELLNILERPMYKKDFVGVFNADTEYKVTYKGNEIGSISYFMYEQILDKFKKKKPSDFSLANKAWKVDYINETTKKIVVERSNKKNIPFWFSRGESISFDFAQAIKKKLQQSFDSVDSYFNLMEITTFSKPFIQSAILEAKAMVDYSKPIDIASIESGESFLEKIYTYFGDKGNYFFKCLLEICEFEVQSDNFIQITIRSESGLLNSVPFTKLIFSGEKAIKEALFEYFFSHFKLVDHIYELFGDKLEKYIPYSVKTRFVTEYLYDERVIEILGNSFKCN